MLHFKFGQLRFLCLSIDTEFKYHKQNTWTFKCLTDFYFYMPSLLLSYYASIKKESKKYTIKKLWFPQHKNYIDDMVDNLLNIPHSKGNSEQWIDHFRFYMHNSNAIKEHTLNHKAYTIRLNKKEKIFLLIFFLLLFCHF